MAGQISNSLQELVEVWGFEPQTFSLRMTRSSPYRWTRNRPTKGLQGSITKEIFPVGGKIFFLGELLFVSLLSTVFVHNFPKSSPSNLGVLETHAKETHRR